MGDFPAEWTLVRDLNEGGQAHTFMVKRSRGNDDREYVLKRLKNPKRLDYFEREIDACTTLDHPNILRVLENGKTPKGKPFLITEYCPGGSLKPLPKIHGPGDGLRLFEPIVAALDYAHTREHPIYHLDLKPENIFVNNGVPVVGDWGICFVEDGELAMTKEGPRGSMYYCAPELRGPKISGTAPLSTADIYSLGKILYFLFTGDVYDGHEEDYSNDTARTLAALNPSDPQMALVDDLIAKTVRRTPGERLSTATELLSQVRNLAKRIELGGRVLDLRIPQRCLYCAEGSYMPAHDRYWREGLSEPKFPHLEDRKKADIQGIPERSRYAAMRETAVGYFGVNRVGIPLILICNHCGNLQYFRLDVAKDGRGENWRP